MLNFLSYTVLQTFHNNLLPWRINFSRNPLTAQYALYCMIRFADSVCRCPVWFLWPWGKHFFYYYFYCLFFCFQTTQYYTGYMCFKCKKKIVRKKMQQNWFCVLKVPSSFVYWVLLVSQLTLLCKKLQVYTCISTLHVVCTHNNTHFSQTI